MCHEKRIRPRPPVTNRVGERRVMATPDPSGRRGKLPISPEESPAVGNPRRASAPSREAILEKVRHVACTCRGRGRISNQVPRAHAINVAARSPRHATKEYK